MRLEYKFLISNDLLPVLRAQLKPYVNVDAFAEQRDVLEYTVRSIYFDTLNLKYYFEKQDGIKVRQKLRVRGYNQHNELSIAFLEIKKKYNNTIEKVRSTLYFKNLQDFFATNHIEPFILHDYTPEAKENAARFLYHLNRKSLRPVVLVVYDREAFHCKFNDGIRITFDKNLRYNTMPDTSDLFQDLDLTYAIPNHSILEIKFFGGFPFWLQAIIEKFDLQRSALSKYTICLDSHTNAKPFRDTRHMIFQSNRINPNFVR